MDEPTRLRMRRAHANRVHTCACGKVLHGNGHTAHLRACLTSLDTRGWPLDDGMAAAVREEYPSRTVGDVPFVIAVERKLGAFYAKRRRAGDKTVLAWPAHRDLIWQCAAEVAAEHRTVGNA